VRANTIRPRSGDLWAPYVPDDAMPWDLRRVVHLHRRAGFAATWDEIRRDHTGMGWIGLASKEALGGAFEPLPLFHG
jgi:hypothetical protein